MTPRPPDRVRIVGFSGDAPGCGARASSWELVRLLHEIWPAGEPFDLRVGAADDDPADGRTEIILVQDGATRAAAGRHGVPVLGVNGAGGAAADDARADTAILTDPLEHGDVAEWLAGHRYFCVVSDAWHDAGAGAALPRVVDEVARATGLVPVPIMPCRPARPVAGAADARPPGPSIPSDMPYPAVAHLLGEAVFVLGGDPRLAQMAAIGGTPSVPAGGDRSTLVASCRLLGGDWPVRGVDEIDAIVADARGLQAAPPGAREALRRRSAALREETRAALRHRLESLVPVAPVGGPAALGPRAVPPGPRILPQLEPLTIYLRRGARPASTFRCLRQLVEGNLPAVLEQLDSRWLVSVCDSYADHGDPLSARNALLISAFIAWERLAATHARWADPQRTTMRVDAPPPATNGPLWDGLVTVHLRRGDTVNNVLIRYARMLAETPVLLAVWRELLARVRAHDSVLAALDRPHGHLFDERLDWLADPGLVGVPRWRRPGVTGGPGSPGP